MLVLVVQCAEPYEIVVRPTTKYVGCMCTYTLWYLWITLSRLTHVAQGTTVLRCPHMTTLEPPPDHLRYQLCPIRANEYIPCLKNLSSDYPESVE